MNNLRGRKSALSILLAAALVPGLARAQLVDTFNSGGHEIYVNQRMDSGGSQWFNYADPRIAGGARQMHARDGHSGTIGLPLAFTLDDAAGTLEWWGGATAPEIWVQYGSAISDAGGGQPVNLNLAKTLADTLQIDVVHGTPVGRPDGRLYLTLYTGAGSVSWSSPEQETAGTRIVRLGDIAGMTAERAADIDGIRVASSATYYDGSPAVAHPTAKGEGIMISEVRLGAPRSKSLVLMIF